MSRYADQWESWDQPEPEPVSKARERNATMLRDCLAHLATLRPGGEGRTVLTCPKHRVGVTVGTAYRQEQAFNLPVKFAYCAACDAMDKRGLIYGATEGLARQRFLALHL